MGNRAVLLFDQVPGMGVYLHWNGGRASIQGFLNATREQVNLSLDSQINIARLLENIGLFFPGSLSFYIGTPDSLDQDNYDNGVYKIDARKLEIIGRKYNKGPEEIDADKTAGIAREIKARRIAAESLDFDQ